MAYTMNIRQAARWAESKDALHIHGDFQNPMYAVYDASWKAGDLVLCMGSYEKCKKFMQDAGCDRAFSGAYSTTRDGKTVRLYCLETILQEMGESEAEALIPECDYRREEWAH